jgi:hypothetical protein
MNTQRQIFGAVAVALALAATSQAVIMDESTLGSYPMPGRDLYVDWIVQDAASFGFAGSYAYLYQLEVPVGTGTKPDIFTVTFDTSGVIVYGSIAGDDLDFATFHPAHTVGGEGEGYALSTVPAVATLASDNISWSFVGGLTPGTESMTLFFIDPRPPTLGVGGAQDGSPPSPWSSLATGGELVPIPGDPETHEIPDGGSTVLLLGVALSALGFVAKRIV